MEKVSIIVPVYNVDKFINKCVDSIINQTYHDLEIILVDDGSTDNSSSICDSYLKKDSRIKVYHKRNGGLSDARNYGIDNSTSKYITFIDSDDWIEKDTIELLMNSINEDHVDIVCYGMTIDYSDGINKVSKPYKKEILNSEDAIVRLNTFSNINISACNKLYKKEIFDDIRFPKGKYCEDYYIMYKLFFKSNTISILPLGKYHYFQRVGSISKSSDIRYDYIYASKEQQKFLSKKGDYLKSIGNLAYAFSNITIYNAKLIRNDYSNIKELILEAKMYKKDVLNCKDLKLNKKIQFLIFIYMTKLYNCIFKLKRKW